jgi:hypothetical protein
MVLCEFCKIAFGNLRNYFLPDGAMKPVHELTEDEAAALWSVSVSDAPTGNMVKIRMYNKLTALDKIAKHINFYKSGAPEPEKVYVYLDKEELCEDDLYGDEHYGTGNPPIDDELQKDTGPQFNLDLDKNYAENLNAINIVERQLKREVKHICVDDDCADAEYANLPLNKELDVLMRQMGVGIGGCTGAIICEKFDMAVFHEKTLREAEASGECW